MHAEIISTYRLQLTPSFGFEQAAAIIPYLSRLGISHVYLSPILQAVGGSEHGYDVTDPTKVSEDLGGETGLRELFREVVSAGMGVVLDIVPNHLAAVASNVWWSDVLKHGQASRHAAAFDIDWCPPDPTMAGKVLLPILGGHPGDLVETGKISTARDSAGEWSLIYEDHRLPVNQAGAAVLESPKPDLMAVLDCQYYRLCHFSLAAEDINYRRFFAVNSLAGLRVEDEAVWETTHGKILDVCATGPVDGLRVDHPDGLRDPSDYFRKLRDHFPDGWIVAEKILETGELMPAWPVDGTTGYDFLQMVGGLWIDQAGEKSVSEFYSDFSGHLEPYGILVRDKKRDILRSSFVGDLDRLVRLLKLICDRRHVDYPKHVLRNLLSELIACFPVYRTYMVPERGEHSPSDRKHVVAAISSVRRSSSFDESLLLMVESILLSVHNVSEAETEFVARFQQLTSPVMAKGVEDTALYCYDRMLALNEVGCDPTCFGISPEIFHSWNTDAQDRWPLRMLATSTHDTKRSEDVRARLSVISEMGEEWADQVCAWSHHNFHAWEGRTPDKNAEHLLYQTLAGAWPIEQDRVQAYMMKACREANRYTSWEAPDDSYEKRISRFVETVLDDEIFIRMLEDFLPSMAGAGQINSLAQTLVKMTAPGIPDIYQGCEIWDNSLVDPDNRRAVDFSQRAALLDELEMGRLSAREIMSRTDEGLPKLHVIRQALAARRRNSTAFAAGPEGSYRPLLVTGPKLANVVAYSRGGRVAIVVPRLGAKLKQDWGDTRVELGEGQWINVLDGSPHVSTTQVSTLFRDFPVALLEKQ